MFNPVVKNLVRNAVKTFGENTEQILSFVEDQATPKELSSIKAFLSGYSAYSKLYGPCNLEEFLTQLNMAGA